MDWQKHMEASNRAQAEAARQQAERLRINQEKIAEDLRILRGMDLVVKDFLGSANKQGFPGAVPNYVRVQRKIVSGYKDVQVGRAYTWKREGYDIYGEPSSLHVLLNGDWDYKEGVEVPSIEYATHILCQNRADKLTVSLLSHFGAPYESATPPLTDSTTNNLMGVLSSIAVENSIRL